MLTLAPSFSMLHHRPNLQPEMATIGSTINGRYEVLRKCGSGNFGTVYECRDRQHTSKNVAVKLVKKGCEREFLDFEVKTMETIVQKDPSDKYGLLKIRGRVNHQGYQGAVFDLKGKSLDQVNGSMAWSEVMRVAKDCGEALCVLHTELKCVHGDLKIDNVMQELSSAPDGRKYCLVDFGVSGEIRAGSDPHRSPAGDARSLAAILFQLRAGYMWLNSDSKQTSIAEMRQKLRVAMSPETPQHEQLVDTLAKALSGDIRNVGVSCRDFAAVVGPTPHQYSVSKAGPSQVSFPTFKSSAAFPLALTPDLSTSCSESFNNASYSSVSPALCRSPSSFLDRTVSPLASYASSHSQRASPYTSSFLSPTKSSSTVSYSTSPTRTSYNFSPSSSYQLTPPAVGLPAAWSTVNTPTVARKSTLDGTTRRVVASRLMRRETAIFYDC